MGSTNFVPQMWLPDIQVWPWPSSKSPLSNFHLVDINIITSNNILQIYKCKQFLLRSIVTDVAGLIIFKNKNVTQNMILFDMYLNFLSIVNLLQILYTVSTEVIIACPMKFAAYPLDHQLCKFLVTSSLWIQHPYDCHFYHQQQHHYHHLNCHLLPSYISTIKLSSFKPLPSWPMQRLGATSTTTPKSILLEVGGMTLKTSGLNSKRIMTKTRWCRWLINSWSCYFYIVNNTFHIRLIFGYYPAW